MRLPGLWRARMAVGVPTMVLAAVLVAAAAKAPPAAAPATTTTRPPPAGAVPSAGTPSPWLALALALTRGWERATG